MLEKHPVLLVLLAAVIAPFLAELPIGRRVPVVVLEVLLGILIGPHVLDLAQMDAFVHRMQGIGMEAILFTAGMEIDFGKIRGRPLSLALRGWVASLGVGLLFVALLHVIHGVQAPLMTTIALATTGLGVVIPVLRDGMQLDSPFGRMVLAAGTASEVGSIVAVSLLLSDRYATWQEVAFLVAFLGLVAVAAVVGMSARPSRLIAVLTRTMKTSSQLPIRLALLVMVLLFAISQELGFEGVLGAFAAGMIVGLATRSKEGEQFRVKMDAVCFGWLTPFFFIGTGVAFDLGAMVNDVVTILLVPTFLILFLATRGLPVLFYRDDLPKRQMPPFALFSSVASLALIVVITQIGQREQSMNRDVAQALVGAALLSSLVYPTLAGMLLGRRRSEDADPHLAAGRPGTAGSEA